MRTRTLLAAILAFAATGCVVKTEPPPDTGPFPGNITVQWTFSDADNCANINHVEIDIPGEFSQAFPCSDGAEVITNFNPGTYQVTVTAIDNFNNVAYQGTADVTVNGDVSVSVVLVSQGPAPGNLDVAWTFSDGNNCASVATVEISGDGLPSSQPIACGAGSASIPSLPGGTYQITVTGFDANGNAVYQGTGSALVNGDSSVTVVLGPLYNITLLWTFPGGETCAAAGVDTVTVTIPGQQLPNAGTFPCDSPQGVQGVTLTGFAPASYDITVSALSTGNYTYSGETTANVVNGDVQVGAVLQ